MKARVSACLAALLLGGCAAKATTRVNFAQARLERAEQHRAKERAPELFRRFEQTRAEAERAAPGSAERADYETEARLWLESAIAEAERSALSEARLVVERETAELEARIQQDEEARAELAQAAERAAARALAQRQAELALTRANAATRNQVRLGRSELTEAASALLTRAALVHAALQLWQPEAPDTQRLAGQLERGRNLLSKAPDEALSLADRALFAGLARLGELRGSSLGPSESERAALAEALQQTGAEVLRNDRGLAAVYTKNFTGNALTTTATRQLARVCAIAEAHPHGPLQVLASGRTPAEAQARARQIREALVHAGCRGPRVQVDAREAAEEALELTWLAY